MLSLVLIAVLYPLIYIVSASFSSANAVISGKVWLYPVEPTLDGYKAIMNHRLLGISFFNAIFYTCFGTMINVVLTIMAAYPLSRSDFYGRNAIMFLFVFTMLFSGGLIPTYIVVKDLGLLNTRWAMLIPSALAVWNVIIARTYFQITIPKELLESTKIDGCDDFRFVFRFVIPLSGPIVAVTALFYAIGHWNSFFSALIYLKNEKLYPLQLVLREILIQNQVGAEMVVDVQDQMEKFKLRELLKYSLIVFSSVPLLIVYPFVQKYFVKGIMIGSLKG